MSERRKFLKGFGLLGAVAGGAATAKVVVEHRVVEEKKPVEDISHLAPENLTTLVIQGNPKPVETPASSNGYVFMPTNREFQNKVHLSVGKDNRLWIKVDDVWKRVSVE
jgi:hypothetical protein